MVQPLLGGVLIGLAATVLLALNGRIAGNSSMLHGLLPPQKGDADWRVLYLVGLVAGAAGYGLLQPQELAAEAAHGAPPLAVVVGGVLVGLGTRLSGGCTSGHGVCGIGRLSVRSLVATLIFMAAGMLTVTLLRWL